MFVLNTKAPRISWLIAASTAAAACALLIAYFLLPSGDEKPKRSTGVASATANPGPNPHLRKEPPEDRIAALPTTGSHSSGLENSSAQQKPLTFESAGDLYALASRALNSKDPMELYNGWIATRICTRAASDRATLEHLIAIGGKELSRFEAVRSAKIIINRCHGFFNNDHAANLGFEARFEEKIRTNPDFYFEGAASTAPTDEQFASILPAIQRH